MAGGICPAAGGRPSDDPLGFRLEVNPARQPYGMRIGQEGGRKRREIVPEICRRVEGGWSMSCDWPRNDRADAETSAGRQEGEAVVASTAS